MKLPVKWLKEYINFTQDSQELAEMLTMSGTAVEHISRVAASDVLTLEITTNRPDCLSVTGIAHEVAALTGKRVIRLKRELPKAKSIKPLPIEIKIQDLKGCPHYLGRVFDKLQVGASPKSIQDPLTWMGQKTVNNVVDITNYVLFEIGQPLHAFDYDKIKGAKILVRRARKGEKIVGINGVEYALDERILVIADSVKPIAIAGVMGGKETEVTSQTKRIVLESAQFDPILVRRTSRFLKISTDSSHRFERGIAPRKVLKASDRATHFLRKLAHAQAASKVVSVGKLTITKDKLIPLKVNRVNEVLGLSLTSEKIGKILKSLGFKVSKKSKREFKVKTRAMRADVREEADLFEEIARIRGFHHIPSQIPLTRHNLQFKSSDDGFTQTRELKRALAALGFSEVITFGLVSEKALNSINWPMDKPLVRVKNPASHEQEILRPSGLPGLLGVIARNVNRKLKDVLIFEIGKRYLEGREENVLSLAMTGQAAFSWEQKKAGSFYHLKGVAENVFLFLRKSRPPWTNEPYLKQTFKESLSIFHNDKRIATCGTLLAGVLDGWDIPQNVYFAEINLEEAFKLSDKPRHYQELPQHPTVRRDISMLIPHGVTVYQIEHVIKETAGEFLSAITLFDEYRGKSIAKGKRSLAFSVEYQKSGTFTDEEIRILHDQVLRSLKNQFGVEFRQGAV